MVTFWCFSLHGIISDSKFAKKQKIMNILSIAKKYLESDQKLKQQLEKQLQLLIVAHRKEEADTKKKLMKIINKFQNDDIECKQPQREIVKQIVNNYLKDRAEEKENILNIEQDWKCLQEVSIFFHRSPSECIFI